MTRGLFQYNPTTPQADAFLATLQEQVAKHPVLRHPFLVRFSQERLTIEQMGHFAVQHYMYSRDFTRNLAAAVSTMPDEKARNLLILNMYEEIGEPLKFRFWTHRLLIEAGVVPAEEVGKASIEALSGGLRTDVTQVLISKGLVTREQVGHVIAEASKRASELTHPALFRRFLSALSIKPDQIDRIEPLPETSRLIGEYRQLCRGHWVQALAALGPGTECVVPTLYTYIERGIENSGALHKEAYVFWTIHIHCDEGHGKNLVDALAPHAADRANQQLILEGTRRVLDARANWLDGLQRLVFQR